MQDVLLEPYGGEILGLSVGATTALTGAARRRRLCRLRARRARCSAAARDPHRLAGFGALHGLVAFAAVIFAAPFESPLLFRAGPSLIGFGGGLFASAR